MQAKVHIPIRYTEITVLRNMESSLTENKIEEHECTSTCILLQGSFKIVAGKTGFPLKQIILSLVLC